MLHTDCFWSLFFQPIMVLKLFCNLRAASFVFVVSSCTTVVAFVAMSVNLRVLCRNFQTCFAPLLLHFSFLCCPIFAIDGVLQTGKREADRLLPRVIVLEDLHWIDSGSWELAVDICKLVPGLLVRVCCVVVFHCLIARNPFNGYAVRSECEPSFLFAVSKNVCFRRETDCLI